MANTPKERIIPPQYERIAAYLTERIEIKTKQMHDYVKQHDYAYALREQQVIEECKKLIAVIGGKES